MNGWMDKWAAIKIIYAQEHSLIMFAALKLTSRKGSPRRNALRSPSPPSGGRAGIQRIDLKIGDAEE